MCTLWKLIFMAFSSHTTARGLNLAGRPADHSCLALFLTSNTKKHIEQWYSFGPEPSSFELSLAFYGLADKKKIDKP